MPKLKTHKGLKKSIRVSKNGKIIRKKAGKAHLLTGKSSKRRRSLKKTTTAAKSLERKVKNLIV